MCSKGGGKGEGHYRRSHWWMPAIEELSVSSNFKVYVAFENRMEKTYREFMPLFFSPCFSLHKWNSLVLAVERRHKTMKKESKHASQNYLWRTERLHPFRYPSVFSPCTWKIDTVRFHKTPHAAWKMTQGVKSMENFCGAEKEQHFSTSRQVIGHRHCPSST